MFFEDVSTAPQPVADSSEDDVPTAPLVAPVTRPATFSFAPRHATPMHELPLHRDLTRLRATPAYRAEFGPDPPPPPPPAKTPLHIAVPIVIDPIPTAVSAAAVSAAASSPQCVTVPPLPSGDAGQEYEQCMAEARDAERELEELAAKTTAARQRREDALRRGRLILERSSAEQLTTQTGPAPNGAAQLEAFAARGMDAAFTGPNALSPTERRVLSYLTAIDGAHGHLHTHDSMWCAPVAVEFPPAGHHPEIISAGVPTMSYDRASGKFNFPPQGQGSWCGVEGAVGECSNPGCRFRHAHTEPYATYIPAALLTVMATRARSVRMHEAIRVLAERTRVVQRQAATDVSRCLSSARNLVLRAAKRDVLDTHWLAAPETSERWSPTAPKDLCAQPPLGVCLALALDNGGPNGQALLPLLAPSKAGHSDQVVKAAAALLAEAPHNAARWIASAAALEDALLQCPADGASERMALLQQRSFLLRGAVQCLGDAATPALLLETVLQTCEWTQGLGATEWEGSGLVTVALDAVQRLERRLHPLLVCEVLGADGRMDEAGDLMDTTALIVAYTAVSIARCEHDNACEFALAFLTPLVLGPVGTLLVRPVALFNLGVLCISLCLNQGADPKIPVGDVNTAVWHLGCPTPVVFRSSQPTPPRAFDIYACLAERVGAATTAAVSTPEEELGRQLRSQLEEQQQVLEGVHLFLWLRQFPNYDVAIPALKKHFEELKQRALHSQRGRFIVQLEILARYDSTTLERAAPIITRIHHADVVLGLHAVGQLRFGRSPADAVKVAGQVVAAFTSREHLRNGSDGVADVVLNDPEHPLLRLPPDEVASVAVLTAIDLVSAHNDITARRLLLHVSKLLAAAPLSPFIAKALFVETSSIVSLVSGSCTESIELLDAYYERLCRGTGTNAAQDLYGQGRHIAGTAHLEMLDLFLSPTQLLHPQLWSPQNIAVVTEAVTELGAKHRCLHPLLHGVGTADVPSHGGGRHWFAGTRVWLP